MDLNELYNQQIRYNRRLREHDRNHDPHFWTKQYLLGMMSEFDEVLDAINWKRHRQRSSGEVDLFNVAYELADILKYLLSICEVWNIPLQSLLDAAERKGMFLEQQWKQEFQAIPLDRPVLITDIDGTLGDWRSAFIEWLRSRGVVLDKVDSASSLNLDSDLAIRYPNYFRIKEEFEGGGGYRSIPPYEDAQIAMRNLQEHHDAFVIAVTARPVGVYPRIWHDTWLWLKDHNFQVDQLHFSTEPRILLADQLQNSRNVILWEDNPGLMIRAASSGIPVFARRHGYNKGISHPNIEFVEKYTEVTDFFRRRA